MKLIDSKTKEEVKIGQRVIVLAHGNMPVNAAISEIIAPTSIPKHIGSSTFQTPGMVVLDHSPPNGYPPSYLGFEFVESTSKVIHYPEFDDMMEKLAEGAKSKQAEMCPVILVVARTRERVRVGDKFFGPDLKKVYRVQGLNTSLYPGEFKTAKVTVSSYAGEMGYAASELGLEYVPESTPGVVDYMTIDFVNPPLAKAVQELTKGNTVEPKTTNPQTREMKPMKLIRISTGEEYKVGDVITHFATGPNTIFELYPPDPVKGEAGSLALRDSTGYLWYCLASRLDFKFVEDKTIDERMADLDAAVKALTDEGAIIAAFVTLPPLRDPVKQRFWTYLEPNETFMHAPAYGEIAQKEIEHEAYMLSKR